jgi:hypothetical protein
VVSKANNYAHLCVECKHLLTRHGLAADAPSLDGPYECAECGCKMRRPDRVIGLTEVEYRSRYAPVNK